MTASYDAVLFDLDGALTSTAALHVTCWKRVFDAALADWTARTGAVRRGRLGVVTEQVVRV
jgi:beta-phosphoglucomutase-like phosphatase (HAD superfamily)